MKDINSRIRVLVADDHSVVRTGIRQFLETADDIIVTAEAGDGEEAIQLIDQDPPDVVVLDIQMPKMTGIEVTRWIRSNHPQKGIPIPIPPSFQTNTLKTIHQSSPHYF